MMFAYSARVRCTIGRFRTSYGDGAGRFVAPFLALVFVLGAQGSAVQAEDQERGFYVTNLTSSSATFVFYSGTGDGWVKVAGWRYEVKPAHGVCYIQVSGLQAGTPHDYVASTGEKGTFRTLANSSLGLPSHIMYGTVSCADGVNPDGVALLLWVSSPTARSAPLSCRITNRYWLVDLAGLRSEDGNAFNYDIGYGCTLMVFGGDLGGAKKTVQIEDVEDQDCGNIEISGASGTQNHLPPETLYIMFGSVFIGVGVFAVWRMRKSKK